MKRPAPKLEWGYGPEGEGEGVEEGRERGRGGEEMGRRGAFIQRCTEMDLPRRPPQCYLVSVFADVSSTAPFKTGENVF